MNRKQFFKNAGLGLGVAVLSPQLLFSSEEVASSKNLPELLGQHGESFELTLSKKFKHGDVLTDDFEFGQQIIVIDEPIKIDEKGCYVHTFKIVTRNKKESLSSSFHKGRKLYRIDHRIGEVTLNPFNSNREEFKKYNESFIV